MSRTSKRKAAVNRAKLANSILPAQKNVQMKMMELLEERKLFTALPSPSPSTVLNLSQIAQGQLTNGVANSTSSAQTADDSTAPSVAVDLNDPQKVVAVWTTHHTQGDIPYEVFAAFSINGGGTWTGFNLAPTDPTIGLDGDPDIANNANGNKTYNRSKDASVAIDRNDQVYVVFRELNSAETGGEIVLQKFDFSGVAPVVVSGLGASLPIINANGQEAVIDQFVAAGDTALEPMVAVDNNISDPSKATDTDSNGQPFVQTDPFAGNVYVAWATDDQLPAGATANKFNGNHIRMVVTSDGGTTFSTPILVSDTSNGIRGTSPRLVVSQGSPDRKVKPGQVTVVWDGYNSTANNSTADEILTDVQPGGVSYQTSVGPTPIIDATKVTGQPDMDGVTEEDFTVNINNPNFDITGLTDLSLNISSDHPTLADLDIQLIAPDGTVIQLFRNKTDESGNPIKPAQGITGTSLGIATSGQGLGATFIDSASQNITAGTGGRVGFYRPEQGKMLSGTLVNETTTGTVQNPGTVNGVWRLIITDHHDGGNGSNGANLLGATLTLSSGIASATTGSNVEITSTLVRGALQAPYPLKPAANPTAGIGPGAVIAADNTLGAYSQFSGRLYVAFLEKRAADITDSDQAILFFSDDGGHTWLQSSTDQGSGLIAPDQDYLDGFSEDYRPQFQPQLDVDQSTGTLVASMYDARYDAARARVAMIVTDSTDGGFTFSPVSFANAPKTAIDAITDKLVTVGPILDNQSSGNSVNVNEGFGERQGLAVYGGRVFAVWSGNLDGTHSPNDVGDPKVYGLNHQEIYENTLTIASGPRVIDSTMGAVGEPSDTVNGSHAADGSPQASTINVTFDRPVDPNSFTQADVQILYRDINTAGSDPATATITPSGVTFDPTSAVMDAAATRILGYTRFVISFAPSKGVGTYSYIIGPNISDKIKTTGLKLEPSQTGLNFPSTDTPIAIPDATNTTIGETQSVITVPSNGFQIGEVISKVTVSVDITHTNDSDLELVLEGPDGTEILLEAVDGGTGHNFTGTVFDDSAAQSITQGTAPFTGSFSPEDALSSFNGTTPVGAWTLFVLDGVTGHTGTLNSWSLTFNTSIPTAGTFAGNPMDQTIDGTNGQTNDAFSTEPSGDNTILPLIVPGPHIIGSNVPGNPQTSDNLVLNSTVSSIDVTFDRDMNDSTILGADVLSIVGPNGTVAGPFTMALSPANASPSHHRTYRISFPSQQLSGTYTIQLSPNIKSAAGDKIDANLNAGLDKFRSVASAGTTPITYTSTIPAAIGSNSAVLTTTSIIHVNDSFPVQEATLQLNITHPNDPDLEAVLIGPDGTTIKLFTNIGASGTHANFTNTTFDDNPVAGQTNGTPIQSGGAPFFGTFQPQQPLSAFIGKGSQGDWTLKITDDKPLNNGTLNSWSLTLTKAVSLTGLGEGVADRSNVTFRISTLDVSNPLSRSEWSPLGPAGISNTNGTQGGAGRVSSIAVDPSDPSGNTVYVAGSGGGVWKTTDFLTHAASGPTYIPLTDSGPTNALNIGSIAVFGRNNDPNQSIIFAATGDGNVGSPGVGILRSMDGGQTWLDLDSTTNFDASGNPLALTATARDHIFVGTVAYKIVVDPHLSPTGDVIVYAALGNGSTANGGVWRSIDSGKTWQKMKVGNATDITLDQNSASASTGNLQTVYAGFAGDGVYSSPNRGQTWNIMAGGVGDPLILDVNIVPKRPVGVTAPSSTPNGAGGRIVLAQPAITGNRAEDLAYEGWLYAAVATPTGDLQGLYLTKDFGQNWTKIRLPEIKFQPGTAGLIDFRITNDGSQGDTNFDGGNNPVSSNSSRGANYAMSLAIDPTNPNIVYLGGSDDSLGLTSGLIRIDTTKLYDAHSDVAYDDTQSDGGKLAKDSVGPVQIKPTPFNTDPVFFSGAAGLGDSTPFLNLIRDPNQPFVAGATIGLSDVANFTNTGLGATYTPLDKILSHEDDGGLNAGFTSILGSNQHTIVTMIDPTTGLPRLLLGNDQGVYSIVDQDGVYFHRSPGIDFTGNGANMLTPEYTSDPAQGARNGNLQLAQLNDGAVQPSTAGATTAGGLVYGSTEGAGSPQSVPTILTDGNLTWTGGDSSRVVGIATDQQGLGTVYKYVFPSSSTNVTDFFQVNGVGRTFGLLQTSGTGLVPDPQWPFFSGPTGNTSSKNFPVSINGQGNVLAPGTFTVNPLNGDQIVISSLVGRVFSTENQGRIWSVIANPTDLDSTYVPVLTYGAPDPNGPGGVGNLNNYVFAGTSGGHVFVTFTGGGGTGNAWKNISNGLDGSPVVGITADPVRGSHDAYAVTQKGIYFMADTTAVSPAWVNITGSSTNSIFAQTHVAFNNTTQTEKQAKQLTSIVADWRYAIPDNPTQPNSTTHPALYVAADSGVYRSLDKGATWKLFPNQATDGTVTSDGGLLPSAPVSQLSLSLGNIDPNTGEPSVPTGNDLLVASTLGRGSFGIRLAPIVTNLGLQGGGNTTPSNTPTITGYSEQSAFGNNVSIKLFDVTDPNNHILVGTGQTDATGKFTITLNPGFSVGGARVLAAEATDSFGLTGPDATFNITVNSNQAPQITIADVSQNEGNSGTTTFTFNLSLDKASATPITVNYTTADSTATVADGDYTAKSGIVTFAANQTSQQITVSVNGDTKFENNEAFFVNLSGASSNAAIGDPQAIGNITNDDTQPTISIGDVTQAEGNSGTTPFNFNVTLSNPSSQTITVAYNTADGTATVLNSDYTAATGTVTFAPGVTTQQISVLVNGDTVVEPNETFNVNLSTPLNATINDGVGLGTINNDDAAGANPTISINDVTQAEGNSGTTAFTFNVTLSAASANTVTVAYATADNTATVADGDYTAKSGTITFAPNVTSQQITILVNGDTKAESDEKFFVNLTSPSNATIFDSQGVGTITNDDGSVTLPSISIADVTQNEGNSGTSTFNFNLSLSQSSATPVTVQYATADGTATTADSDYVAKTGTVTFAAGQVSQQISITVNGDTKVESNETFVVNLSSPSGATISDNQATGTITNDDGVANLPTLSIGNVTQVEGNSGTTAFNFNVMLSATSQSPVTVQFATADGTATVANSDYQAKTGSITFGAGVTSQQISILVNGDTTLEANETFSVNLSNPSGATIATGTGVGTITNDDGVVLPTITIGNVSQNEGNSGTSAFTFNLMLSQTSASPVTVQFATADGSATIANNDYQSKSGTVTFGAGITTQQITVLVNGDTVNESDETFVVNLSSPTNATLANTQGTATIVNDDGSTPPPPTPSISISDVTQAEGNSGTSNFTFNLSLSQASATPVTVQFATADNTATVADGDYQAKSGTITFAANQTTQQITVLVNGDTKAESNETFFVNLSTPSGATIADNQATGTITNDDATPPSQPTISINDVIAHEGTASSGTKPFIFTISLSQASASNVIVHYATADGTAKVSDNDYTAISGNLTFTPGQISQTISVPVIQDSKVESDETFFVNLSAPSGATIADGQGMATVQNDDSTPVQPKITITDVSKAEGNSGTTAFAFTVSLSNTFTSNVTVKYATADGTTTSGTDYTAASSTLTFTPGQTSKTITVNVKGDTTQEADEYFFVNLSTPTNATISDAQGFGTIQNDDATGTALVKTVTDPTNSAVTALQVIGTSGNDTISITSAGAQGKAKVTVNGANKGTFSFTGGIFVYGQNGNDNITIDPAITRSAYLFGGAGNDVLNGGGGPDVLLGQEGNDQLNGNAGRDILIGGGGTDNLNGGADDDVLDAGDVNNLPSFSNLASLLKEWTRTDIAYAARVTHLSSGGGQNKINLNANTSFSSAALVDSLTGGAGNDFFLAAVSGDKILDKISGETIIDIGD